MFSREKTDSMLVFLQTSCKRLLGYFDDFHRYVSTSSEGSVRIAMTQEFTLLYKRTREFCGKELFDEKIKGLQAECEAEEKGLCTLCLKEPSVEDNLCKDCNERITQSVDEAEKEVERQEFIDMDAGKQKH